MRINLDVSVFFNRQNRMKKGDILVVLEVTCAFFLKAREESLFGNDHRKCPPGRGKVSPALGSGALLKGTAAGPW